MSVVRRVARPLLALTFIDGGWDAFRHPSAKAERAAPLIDKLAPALGVPNDPEMLVRANGLTMMGAGVLFALGRAPRTSATVMAVSLIPTTLAGHPFWEADDPAQRRQQRLHFLKNLGLLGGLLIASVDTAGKPGMSWRAQRAAKDASRTARQAKRDARHVAQTARREAKLARAQLVDALPIG
ncbi:DoxX family protein [Angustibacter sp. McL0619]|uniref:DoxX family protein n=1 Tax=Angustibacter sp. McL0619 TaxID=3415676 RepID=UPI003CEE8991